MTKNEEAALLLKLGENIKSIRTRRGISQQSLARMCNIEETNLSNIENGKEDVSISTIAKFSRCFNVPVSKIIE